MKNNQKVLSLSFILLLYAAREKYLIIKCLANKYETIKEAIITVILSPQQTVFSQILPFSAKVHRAFSVPD